jgi:hypothetical protein
MTRIQFDLFSSYSQVAVFTAGLDKPFNDWEQEHFDQGFAWRDGSVSFATLEEGGTLHCEATVADRWEASTEAQRAIRVPFGVTSDSVEIASISDGVVFKLTQLGPCALIFETWIDEHSKMQIRFTFVPVEGVVAPVILKADSGLHPRAQLTMTARPA